MFIYYVPVCNGALIGKKSFTSLIMHVDDDRIVRWARVWLIKRLILLHWGWTFVLFEISRRIFLDLTPSHPPIPSRTNAVNRVFDRQAQPIPSELTAKLLGNRVAVSPIVTVEPRRRKFHKPITLTLPLPQAAAKGMINHYTGDAPTLRLLCSITGKRQPLPTPASPCYTTTTRRYSPPFHTTSAFIFLLPPPSCSCFLSLAPLLSFFFFYPVLCSHR